MRVWPLTSHVHDELPYLLRHGWRHPKRFPCVIGTWQLGGQVKRVYISTWRNPKRYTHNSSLSILLYFLSQASAHLTIGVPSRPNSGRAWHERETLLVQEDQGFRGVSSSAQEVQIRRVIWTTVTIYNKSHFHKKEKIILPPSQIAGPSFLFWMSPKECPLWKV